ncbi:MAG: hypothetical protein KKH75_08740, partial [Actinobacteria bacterium]|nr:hypothetical protein [Actinomycetota bacterium]
MPEPAPTRRSSRALPALAAAPVEDAKPVRAERRGRTVDATSSRPAVVWGRTAASDTVSAPLAPVEATSTAEELPASEPLTRRRARAIAQAGDSTFTAPAEPEHATHGEPELLIVVVDSAESQRIADTDAATSTATDAFELIEPALDEEPAIEEEPVVAFASEEHVSSAAPAIDEFEAAARLFSFTGETPIQVPRAEAAADASASRPVDD